MVKLAPRILEMVVNGACLKLPWPGATTETVELSGADENLAERKRLGGWLKMVAGLDGAR